MKKTSVLLLCTLSLNGVIGTEITSSPEENIPEAQINTTPQLAVRKTGYHAPEPEVLRAAHGVIAKQRISNPSSSLSSRLGRL